MRRNNDIERSWKHKAGSTKLEAWKKDKGLGIKDELAENAESRLTNNDLGCSRINIHSEVQILNQLQNKLKARSSKLTARNNKPKIKPDFTLMVEERTVVKFFKQSTAYET